VASAEKEPTAVVAAGAAFRLVHGDLCVCDLAEQIREHTGSEMAGWLTGSGVDARFSPVGRLERAHARVHLRVCELSPATTGEESRQLGPEPIRRQRGEGFGIAATGQDAMQSVASSVTCLAERECGGLRTDGRNERVADRRQ